MENGTGESSGNPESPWQGFEIGLKRLRSRLLDLTSRNRLLNFKHPEASSLRIVDELPDELFERLTSGDGMAFIPVPLPAAPKTKAAEPDLDNADLDKPEAERQRVPAEVTARVLGLATDFELPRPAAPGESVSRKHKDAFIQTLLYPDRLESVLRKIGSQAKTAVEESGTNMLYLAFGFLDWTESESSSVRRVAPLILMPVLLEKGAVDPKTATYRYTITHSGEDIATNVSLREKLKNDFGLALPDLADDEVPEAYFSRVSVLLESKPDWCIRRQVSLSLFQFGKLLIYLDLDEKRWPSGAGLVDHPILKAMFEGTNQSDTSVTGDWDLDDLSPDLQHLPVISDIDSTQMDAVLEVVRGRNLVIEGPPGTGKSQTIANLIAIALARGQSVLFVSEKLAALEVVRGRLDSVGLGHLCLELHSHKTQKQAFIKDIAERIKRRDEWQANRSGLSIGHDRRAVEECRTQLRDVGKLLGQSIPELGMTVQQVLWWAVRAKQSNPVPDEVAVVLAQDVVSLDLRWRDEAEHAIGVALALLDDAALAKHEGVDPWEELGKSSLAIVEDVETIARSLESACESTQRLQQILAEVAVEAFEPAKVLDISDWIELHRVLESRPTHAFHPVSAIEKDATQQSLRRLLETRESLASQADQIRSVLKAFAAASATSLRRYAELIKTPECIRYGLHSRGMCADVENSAESLLTNCRSLSDELDGPALEKFLSGWAFCVQDLDVLVDLLDVILKRPSAAKGVAGEWLLDDRILGQVRTALSRQEELAEAERELSGTVDLSLAPDMDTATAALSTIEGAGFLKLLSPDYRRAKNMVRSMSRNPDRSDDIGMIQSLRKLLGVGRKRTELAQLYTIQGLPESAQRLLSKSGPEMRQILDWSESVVSRLREGRAEAIQLRKLLLTSPDRFFQAMEQLGRGVPNLSSAVQAIRAALSKLDATGGAAPGIDITARLPRLIEYAERLKSVAHEMLGLDEQLQVAPGCAPSDVTTALHQAEQHFSLMENARSLTADLRRDVPWLDDALSNPQRIGDTAALIDRVHASSLSALGRKVVLDARDAGALSTAEGLASKVHAAWAARRVSHQLVERLPGFGTRLEASTLQEQIAHLRTAIARRDRLAYALERARARSKVASLRVDWLLNSVERGVVPKSSWREVLTTWWSCSWADTLGRKYPRLTEMHASALDLLRQRFASLDSKLVSANSMEVITATERRDVPEGNSKGPKASHTEMGLLRGEIRKQKRHVPIRTLTSNATGALKALKPCFMMGPLSVAQYLGPQTGQFDLLIMDEASQLRPEEAMGAIARAKQIVVVGDPKQLPPTSFFKKAENEDDLDDEEDSGLGEAESILERAAVVFSPGRRLKWHYRSRHESLIAFSNHHFYDKELVLFPAPQEAGGNVGLRRHRVKEGTFHKGVNKTEALELARFVIAQMKERPDESIGVVAMNSQQREFLEECIETLGKSDPAVDAYVQRWQQTSDPFFVKNLENVQGDERDVIVISFTYGPATVGQRPRQAFGPINQSGGWRRLNVLFTRARLRIEAFCSMDSVDVELATTGADARGKHALRDYLKFLEGSGLASEVYGRREPDSDFEVSVANVLSQNGYSCVAQLGVAGYFIDLVVKDPDRPGRYLLGVECDGASYHSARCVRDRDRLRQSVLERMGWKIQRVWSTDWYNNRAAASRRLMSAIESARQSFVDQSVTVSQPPEIEPGVDVTAS